MLALSTFSRLGPLETEPCAPEARWSLAVPSTEPGAHKEGSKSVWSVLFHSALEDHFHAPQPTAINKINIIFQ